MKIKRLAILILVLLIILVTCISDVISADDIVYYDTYTTASSSSDRKVWGGKYLDVTFQNYPSDTMVACWDWCNDGVWDHCYASGLFDLWDCMDDSSALDSYCWDGKCFPWGLASSHDIDTGNPGEAWKCTVDVKYYRACGTGSYQYVHVNEKPYYVVGQRQYNCDSCGGVYDDEGDFGTPGWVVLFNSDISCSSGYGCDCAKDDDQADFGFYGTSIPSAPCSPIGPYCGDGACDSGENGWNCQQDCGEPCSSNQCTSYYWKECYNNGALCCSGDSVFGQWYCQNDETWAECTSSNHVSCQQKGSYYCTYQSSAWRWRECPYGCSGSSCNAPVEEPDIRVEPTSLEFTFDIE